MACSIHHFRPAIIAVLGIAIPLTAAFAGSAGLGQPSADPILTLSGAIAQANDGGNAQFDRDMIEQLPQRTIHTTSPWFDGAHSFEGPLLRDVLALVGAEGTRLRVVALNDYSAEIPVEDLNAYDVVLALRVDGETLSIRDRGPMWIMYPFDDYAELNVETYYGRSVWQVRSIEVLP